jgi:hypothetical protein
MVTADTLMAVSANYASTRKDDVLGSFDFML